MCINLTSDQQDKLLSIIRKDLEYFKNHPSTQLSSTTQWLLEQLQTCKPEEIYNLLTYSKKYCIHIRVINELLRMCIFDYDFVKRILNLTLELNVADSYTLDFFIKTVPSYQEACEVFFKNERLLNPIVIHDFLQLSIKYGENPDQAKQAFKFAQDSQQINKIVLISFIEAIGALSDDPKDLILIRQWYQEARTMKNVKKRDDFFLYSATIKAMTNMPEGFEDAWGVFKDAIGAKIFDPVIGSIMLIAVVRINRFDIVQQIFDRVLTTPTLILDDTKQASSAKNIFETLPLSLSAYRAIMKATIDVDNPIMTKYLFNKAVADKKVDRHVCGYFLQAVGASKNPDIIHEAIALVEKNLPHNECCTMYTSFVKALAEANDYDGIYELYKKYIKTFLNDENTLKNKKAHTDFFKVLINTLMHAGKLQEAQQIFDEVGFLNYVLLNSSVPTLNFHEYGSGTACLSLVALFEKLPVGGKARIVFGRGNHNKHKHITKTMTQLFLSHYQKEVKIISQEAIAVYIEKEQEGDFRGFPEILNDQEGIFSSDTSSSDDSCNNQHDVVDDDKAHHKQLSYLPAHTDLDSYFKVIKNMGYVDMDDYYPTMMLEELYDIDIIDVLGDGNCFFHAIALHQPNYTHTEIRRQAVQELLTHWGLYEDLFENPYDLIGYARAMTTNGIWVEDERIILATANALHRTIVVIPANTNIEPLVFRGIDGDTRPPIYVVYNGINHYLGTEPRPIIRLNTQPEVEQEPATSPITPTIIEEPLTPEIQPTIIEEPLTQPIIIEEPLTPPISAIPTIPPTSSQQKQKDKDKGTARGPQKRKQSNSTNDSPPLKKPLLQQFAQFRS